jgi:hypothetical protein
MLCSLGNGLDGARGFGRHAGVRPARRGLFSLHMAACGGWPGEAARQTGTVGEEMTRWASCFLPFARTHRLLVLVYDPNFKILVACWLLFQGVFHIKRLTFK